MQESLADRLRVTVEERLALRDYRTRRTGRSHRICVAVLIAETVRTQSRRTEMLLAGREAVGRGRKRAGATASGSSEIRRERKCLVRSSALGM